MTLTRAQLERIASLEAAEAVETVPPPDVLTVSFPEQRAFIEDPGRLKYAFCTRRAAKSYSGGLYAYREAFRYERCSVLIVGFTHKKTKRDWWEPVLKDIAHRFGFYDPHMFNESELSVVLPNGSRIYLVGLDADQDQQRNALGGKYPLVVIDEAQDFRSDLRKLVYEILKPAVADYRGTICLLGTPGSITSGLFFEITTGKQPGWSGHSWSALVNTSVPTGLTDRVCDSFRAEMDELVLTHPGIEMTPGYRRNYRGEWVIDDSELVYRYSPERNDFTVLPEYTRGHWHRVLGIDLGWNDPSAFSLIAYHDHDQTLYVETVMKQSAMDITAVANQIRWFQSRYDIDHLVIDGANKQAVEEMRKRHGLALIAADKTGKPDFIELMNSELLTGRIKVDPDSCKSLTDEYSNLIWKLKREGDRIVKREEHPACPNHCTDATLYGWRFTYQYLSEKPKDAPKFGTAAYYELEAERIEEAEEQKLLEEHRERLELEEYL